jgi:hypothetical protein
MPIKLYFKSKYYSNVTIYRKYLMQNLNKTFTWKETNNENGYLCGCPLLLARMNWVIHAVVALSEQSVMCVMKCLPVLVDVPEVKTGQPSHTSL